VDLLQVVLDDPGELALLSTHDGELEHLALAALVGVVEEDLGAVGEEPLGCKRVLSSTSTAGRIRCSGTPARRKLERTNASAKPMKGTVACLPFDGK
jgi:hypothetical protein